MVDHFSVQFNNLAKILGLDVAKNDRHLARIAQHCGYSDAHSLCHEISILTGQSASVVDVVLWRFATMSQNTIPAAQELNAV
ncbi:MAG: hypothetical protein WBF36_00940 [Desulfobulbales bacterium]